MTWFSIKASFFTSSLVTLFVLSLLSCSQIQKPVTEPFFAATAPPEIQEFRWSNGKQPKSFDPARAAAAPETDIVRAIYEGLTELDPRSLDAVPAVAEKWSASEDNRVWTFNLRESARWANGKRVTAHDFVASWKRLKNLGEKTAHRDLLKNIVGFDDDTSQSESTDFQHSTGEDVNPNQTNPPSESVDAASKDQETPENNTANAKKSSAAEATIGVEAIDDTTLKVSLELADKDFPNLVANPIFRPVYGGGIAFEKNPLDKNIVTNGPFTLAESGESGVIVERSGSYWNKLAVKLERIRFVPMETAEAALDAYRKGQIDAVTNAQFEPLALKLLEPFDDFRRTKHSALNFYEFNTNNPPFNDRRVREALATAIDRDRLIETELASTAQPATDFLALGEKSKTALSFDAKNARDLLEKAGYPNGEGIPQIRLVINRNDVQQRVARAIARMWKQNLNIDTHIIVVENNEIEAVRANNDFDIIRRGVVLPTGDELAGMTAIFRGIVVKPAIPLRLTETNDVRANDLALSTGEKEAESTDGLSETDTKREVNVITRDDALYDLRAMPLYFPESYALVKPYVYGFDTNALDAPSIKHIGINNAWQPPNAAAQN